MYSQIGRLEILRWWWTFATKLSMVFVDCVHFFFGFLMFIPILLVEMIIVCLFWTFCCFHLFQIHSYKTNNDRCLTPEFSADATPPQKKHWFPQGIHVWNICLHFLKTATKCRCSNIGVNNKSYVASWININDINKPMYVCMYVCMYEWMNDIFTYIYYKHQPFM